MDLQIDMDDILRFYTSNGGSIAARAASPASMGHGGGKLRRLLCSQHLCDCAAGAACVVRSSSA
jgi:hypothetical protein